LEGRRPTSPYPSSTPSQMHNLSFGPTAVLELLSLPTSPLLWFPPFLGLPSSSSFTLFPLPSHHATPNIQPVSRASKLQQTQWDGVSLFHQHSTTPSRSNFLQPGPVLISPPHQPCLPFSWYRLEECLLPSGSCKPNPMVDRAPPPFTPSVQAPFVQAQQKGDSVT